MKKKFIALMCLLYTLIITYVWIFGKLKNFLAPQMQIYIELSLLPLVIMSLILLFNENLHYKFKWTDLILFLPIIMIFLSGDGRLSEDLAQNRMVDYKKEVLTKEEKTQETFNITKEETEEAIEKVSEDAEIYFDIVDANYQDLANYLTFSQKSDKFAGKTIKVKGFINKSQQYIPQGYYAIGKYSISCCAADASFVGFIVKENNMNLKENNWYEIEGTLVKAKDVAGYDILTINPTNIKKIDGTKEQQYVYPCYNYDDGKCKEMTKYDLAY